MVGSYSLLIVLAGVAGAGILNRRDTTISNSQRVSTYSASFGTSNQLTTVNPGVFYWLSGGGTHNFYGNVFTSGTITVSQTDYLVTTPGAGGQTADFVGHTTTSGNLNITTAGSISLNDYGSASAPTYDWYLRSFTNYGGLQFCGRGDTGGSTYQLYCDLDCFNYGTIEMSQYNDNRGASFVWRNANLAAYGATNYYNIYNNGAFRIVQVVYHNVQNVLGTGCWIIGYEAVLYLEDGTGAFQNAQYGPSWPNQRIYFSDNTGTLHMDTQVYSHNSAFGPQVYGYGAGNAIEFYQTITTTNGFSYDSTTGILTVNFVGGNSVAIKLGLGYSPSLFSQARNPQKYNTAGYNAIFYSGAEPAQSVPTTCQPAYPTCTNPAATAFATATSTTSSTTTPTPTYVTETLLYTGTSIVTGPVTSTVATASGTTPGTVAIYTPGVYVTTSLPFTATGAITTPFTSTIAAPSGTNPGTVAVFTPVAPSYVTTTQQYTGTGVITEPITSTIATPSGTAPGTIAIITPAAYITTSLPYTGAGTITGPITSTIAPSGTSPGTVAIFTPVIASYVTTTLPYSGTDFPSNAITSTIVTASGTNPGTIAVLTPTATRPNPVVTTIGPNQCTCIPS